MGEPQRFTWDGLPVAPDEPFGASIVVRRRGRPDEFLILHRAHHGPAYEGDWAWTPPSGSRQPGEPVLASALRELAEETGLRADAGELRAVDVSGQWAAFALDVPPGTTARVDAEHDRLEWLSLEEALGRCRPDEVAAHLRRAAAAASVRLAFRPLAEADLPDLLAWLRAPHVARWYKERQDPAAVEREYCPSIEGSSPTRVHVVLADGRPCGFVQDYPLGAYPEYAAATGEPDAIGIDYAIGDARLTGVGLGPQIIWQYVREVVCAAYPDARLITASPDVANSASIRALEKAAFRRIREIDPGGDAPRELLCGMDVQKFFGDAATPR